MVMDEFNKEGIINKNYFCDRPDIYKDGEGRTQSIEEAIEKDKEIISLLEEYNLSYTTLPASKMPQHPNPWADPRCVVIYDDIMDILDLPKIVDLEVATSKIN